MAVLDLSTGKRIDQPQPQQPQTNDPLADPNDKLGQFKQLLLRQAKGEQGLEGQLSSLQGELSQQPIQKRVSPQPTREEIDAFPEFKGQDLIPGPKDLIGAADIAKTIGSSIIAEPVAGIAGVLSIPFAESAGDVVNSARDFITLNPSTEEGEGGLQKLSQLLSPVTSIAESAVNTLGDAGFDLAGPAGGAIAKAIPAAILEALGFKGVSRLVTSKAKQLSKSKAAKQAGLDVDDVGTIERTIESATESTKGLEKATGVETGLFPAQKTGLPSELIDQRLLTQLDASSRQAVKALEKQNKQVFEATNELVNKIGSETATEAGASRFRTAAQKALESGKQRRTEKVKPLFDQAIKDGATVDLKPIRQIIDDALTDAPPGGDLTKTMKRIQNLIRSPAKGGAPSLRQLQKAKFQLDDMIEKFGDGALGNSVKREVVEIKKALVVQMEEASPLFKEAQKQFSELSPAVRELEDSILGQVSKLKDTDLKNIAQKLFDPKTASTDPTAILKAKKIIDGVDPGAWDDLLKVELNRRVSAMIETVSEADLATKNIPGQLKRAIFGNAKQRQALMAGMNKEQKKNFTFLEDVLKRAESGRQAGSPTELFKQSTERLKGISGKLRDKIFSPLKSIQETGESALFDRNARKFAEIMFNPKFEPRLAKLRKLDPNSAKAGAEFEKLFEDAKIIGAGLPLVKTENNENE